MPADALKLISDSDIKQFEQGLSGLRSLAESDPTHAIDHLRATIEVLSAATDLPERERGRRMLAILDEIVLNSADLRMLAVECGARQPSIKNAVLGILP